MKRTIILLSLAAILSTSAGCKKAKVKNTFEPEATLAIGSPTPDVVFVPPGEWTYDGNQLHGVATVPESPTPEPSASPTPIPIQITRLEAQIEVLNDVIAKIESAKPTPSPTQTMTPAVDLTNPLETEEERRARAAKRGFLILDDKGKEFVRIHRQDEEDVGLGLYPSTIAITMKLQPIVTKIGDEWEIVFENVIPTPVPAELIPAQKELLETYSKQIEATQPSPSPK